MNLTTTDREPIWEPCLTVRREILTAGGWLPLTLDTHISRFNPTVCRAGDWAMRPEEFERRAALPVPEVRTRVHLGTLTDPDLYPVPRPDSVGYDETPEAATPRPEIRQAATRPPIRRTAVA